MPKNKKAEILQAIWQLADGQKSGLNIGSRAVPHHLRPYEKPILEKAIERGYMILKKDDRPNLENLFYLYNEQLDQPAYIYRESEGFPVQLSSIQEKLQNYNPKTYAKTRNHLEGNVTKLSPYITTGILPLPYVYQFIQQKFTHLKKDDKIFQELAWCEYFKNVYQEHGEEIFQKGIKNTQPRGDHQEIPTLILEARTGIKTIDHTVRELYLTGYMHNHARMWLASLTCNLSRTHWKPSADWLYYHLLDGDLASNYLSWQWVSGAFSNKLYWLTQSNLNKYSPQVLQQSETIIDKSYQEVAELEVPQNFQERSNPDLTTDLSPITSEQYEDKPTLLYSIWNLDPEFRNQTIQNVNTQDYQKILLLEQSYFDKFPVSPQRLAFILGVAQNIPSLKVVVQEKSDLKISPENLTFIDHPSLKHWHHPDSTQLKPPRIFPHIEGCFSSFFKFWNKASRKPKAKTS